MHRDVDLICAFDQTQTVEVEPDFCIAAEFRRLRLSPMSFP